MTAPAGRWRLLVSDLDGTLITGTTALAHLSAWLGHGELIDGLESQLASGTSNDRDVAQTYASVYTGVRQVDAEQEILTVPSLTDIPEAVAALHARSVTTMIATVSWSFAATALADLWSFQQACGADLEVDQATGRFTGKVARHFQPQDKVARVEQICQRLSIGLEHVVAVGDSRSDLPLFQACGFSVALNATPDARAAATTAIDSPSFLHALLVVPDLLV